jgi:ribosomal protein S18 acetylase RimI-like enzyme
VDVRRAEHEEISAAVSVWATANRRPPSGGQADRLRSWSEQDGARLFIAVDDESRVVGTLLSLLGRENDGAGDVVPGWRHLTGVAVLPEWQGSGLGQRLMRATIDDAGSDGITRLTLWAHTHNSVAIRLFESLGFQPTGRTMLDEHGAMLVLLELLVI